MPHGRVKSASRNDSDTMPQLDSRSPKENRPRNNSGDPNFGRGLILVVVAIALIGGALYTRGQFTATEDVPWARFVELIENGQIHGDKPLSLIFSDSRVTQTLMGVYYPKDRPNTAVDFKTEISLDFDKDLQKRLHDSN